MTMNNKIALASVLFFIIMCIWNYVSYHLVPRAIIASLVVSLGYYFLMRKLMNRKVRQ